MAGEGLCTVRFVGVRPSLDQVRLAAGGEIDAMIRAAAHEHDALFVTSDRVQSEVARAKGLQVQDTSARRSASSAPSASTSSLTRRRSRST